MLSNEFWLWFVFLRKRGWMDFRRKMSQKVTLPFENRRKLPETKFEMIFLLILLWRDYFWFHSETSKKCIHVYYLAWRTSIGRLIFSGNWLIPEKIKNKVLRRLLIYLGWEIFVFLADKLCMFWRVGVSLCVSSLSFKIKNITQKSSKFRSIFSSSNDLAILSWFLWCQSWMKINTRHLVIKLFLEVHIQNNLKF